MGSMMGIMDLVVVIAGFYLLYGYYLLMYKNEIKEGIMVSRAAAGKKCKDIEGFKREIGPKVLVCAIVAIINGVAGFLKTNGTAIPNPLYWAMYAVFLAVLAWFMITARKIERKYF